MANNTNNTALLVMDMQTAILGMLPNTSTILGNVAAAIAHARSQKLLVIYVVVGFRQGTPEINMANKSFAANKDRFANTDTGTFTTIHPAVAPIESDIVVTKRRVSAFTGSDLEVVLRAQGIQHLVLMGIATSGVVLSTVREAADKDYQLTVLANCCADGDEAVHQVLTTKVFPRQAEVVWLEEWLAK